MFGWDDLIAKGEQGEQWDGVRNYQARNNMRAMRKGELGLFYHSNIGKEAVGIVKVIAEAHPDSTAADPKMGMRGCEGGEAPAPPRLSGSGERKNRA